MRGGASLVNHSKFQEVLWVAPVVGVSGMATTGRMCRAVGQWTAISHFHLLKVVTT